MNNLIRLVVLFLNVISVFCQRQQGNPWIQQTVGVQPRCDTSGCLCSLEYIPFCGTDGVTYSNKCQLTCAQNCNRGLRVRFEGVCPEPYVHQQGNIRNGGQFRPIQPTRPLEKTGSGYLGFPDQQPTGRPQYYNPFPTGFPSTNPTRRYDSGYYASPTVTPRYVERFPTGRPSISIPIQQTTGKSGRFEQWLATSTLRPPPRDRFPSREYPQPYGTNINRIEKWRK